LGFFGVGQRRGVHVSTPEIGSRGELFCFGGILDSHADLRREIVWGNLDLVIFGVVGVVPRKSIEEGDHCAFPRVFGGTFNVIWVGFVGS
jgi:hypothetical protein